MGNLSAAAFGGGFGGGFGGARGLSCLAFEGGNLVAEIGGALEFEFVGGLEHFARELGDDIGAAIGGSIGG